MTLGWILEETIERYSEVQDFHSPENPLLPFSIPSPPLAHCYLCHEVLIGSESLHDHLLHKHSNRHAYIRINGKVVQEDLVFREDIRSIDVTVTGDIAANARIVLDSGREWVGDGVRGHHDVSNLLKSGKPGKIEFVLLHANHEQRFTIYSDSAPFDRHMEIDRSAFSLLFSPLREGTEPDFQTYRFRHLTLGISGLEARYAEGFFAYAKAFSLARAGNPASKEHFEEAFERLLSFGTPFAVVARRVLALRMNAFHLLRDCAPPSLFSLANDFFNQPEGVPLTMNRRPTGNLAQGDYGVFIDHFTGRFLEALMAYFLADWSNLTLIENELDSRTPPYDRNNSDKLCLLMARSSARKGLSEKAAEYYAMLRYHPAFESEATKWIR